MTVDALIAQCHHLGVSLSPGPEGKLRLSPPGVLPEELRAELSRRKAEILALLAQQPECRRPYINQRGELIIPFDSDPHYHYWAGGQSLAATLRELNAPREVWVRYTDVPYGQVQ